MSNERYYIRIFDGQSYQQLERMYPDGGSMWGVQPYSHTPPMTFEFHEAQLIAQSWDNEEGTPELVEYVPPIVRSESEES